MKQLEWSIQYSTGIPKIDAQHAYLFELANKVAKGNTPSHKQVPIKKVIKELNDYAAAHFGYEEHIMAQAGYENLEEHKKIHAMMRTRLEQMTVQFRQGALSLAELTNFLEEWLTLHILREDMKYIPALAKAFPVKEDE